MLRIWCWYPTYLYCSLCSTCFCCLLYLRCTPIMPGCTCGLQGPFHMAVVVTAGLGSSSTASSPVLLTSIPPRSPLCPGLQIKILPHSRLYGFLKTLNLCHFNIKPQLCLYRSLRKWNLFRTLRKPQLINQKTPRWQNPLQPRRMPQLGLQCPLSF